MLVVGDAYVTVFGGQGLTPTVSAADAGPLDVLVAPGAIAAIGAIDSDAARPDDDDDDDDDDIVALAEEVELLVSVCTGGLFLQRLGLVGEHPVTTHWEDVEALRELGATAGDDVRWVGVGPLVTSGGIRSAIARALHLVARFVDHGLAEATARQIDTIWTEAR